MEIKIDKEFEKLIPKLTDEEFNQLEENCKDHGIQDSIKIWSGENIIIDGHNRYKIAEKNNLQYETEYMSFNNRIDVIEWMINNQRGRRNLNNYDRGLLALKLQDILKIKGLENKSKGGKLSKDIDSESESKTKDLEISPNVNSRKEASKAFNVSDNTLNKVKHIEEKADEEIKEKLKNNEITVNKAYNDIKKKEREEKTEKAKPIKGKYNIVYADPPWKYNDKQNNDKMGGADKHYNTMTIKELCDMPIKDKTEDNAVLFLWVTSPLLEESFKIINAWGFKYKSSFVWDKVKHNMGHYNSVRHEFLLIGIKGSYTPENIKLFDSVQSIERSKKHSEKPEKFREIIEVLYPNGKKIELFARTKTKNWKVWGDEV